ncbi:hypothetical protein WSM22_37010 [Cytophagales bacterium WSM2-2]|nr:hypothetical protein WSM22_37010 [Cytophagales bacterium WSM2-2]
MSAQIPDKIVLNGLCQDLYSNPLEHYWLRNNKRRPSFFEQKDCVRGYVAKWEISNSQLLLKEVKGEYKRWHIFFGREAEDFTIKTLFPKAKNRAVKASWFSGKIRVPQGRMTFFEDRGYDSRFEKEIIITIEKGDVVKSVMIDYQNRVMTNGVEGIKTPGEKSGVFTGS